MAKKKVGKPKGLPSRKISLNLDIRTLEAVRKREKATGETLTDIVINAIYKDMKEYDGSKTAPPKLYYNNRIASGILDKLTKYFPRTISTAMLETTCRELRLNPLDLVKKDLDQIFVDALCKNVRDYYHWDNEKVGHCIHEFERMKKEL
jgi:hypothetical protein